MNARRTGVVALIVGLLIGAAGGHIVGWQNAERDLKAMAFISAASRISTSGTTLRLLEQERPTSVSKLHEVLLKSAIHDALQYSVDELPQSPGSTSSLQRSLAEAEAYAVRRSWNDVASKLRAIQQTLSEAQPDRT